MIEDELPPEPRDLDALRVRDEWWPRAPRPGPFRHSVGVRAAGLGEWLKPGPFDPILLGWLHNLMDVVGDQAFLALPGSEAAGEEALAMVAAAVPDAGLGGASVHDHREGRHPLDVAARLVVEDLCLVDVSGPDPVLIAGSVAMPNRWRLAEKLGHNLFGVHEPVPGYADDIGTATDRLMQRLSEDRIMARSSWAITDLPDLFQPAHSSRVEKARPDVRTGAQAAQALYVRVEYQTVRALPQSRAVLFTIHTAREQLGALADRPIAAASLLAAIEHQSDAQRRYKGVAPYLAPLRECLSFLAKV